MKLIIISLIVSLFIYNRTVDYYKVLPRHNLLVALIVALWTFICFKYNAWFVILGLFIINVIDKLT